MKTYAYIKKYEAIASDVAHIYEHLLIESFYRFAARKLAISRAVIGPVSGRTYYGALFIDAWFYDPRVAALFEDFMRHERIDYDLLEVAAAQTAAENGKFFELTDDFTKDVRRLEQLQWHSLPGYGPELFKLTSRDDPPVPQHKQRTHYKSVLITYFIALEDLTLEERAVFYRFSVILHDIIEAYVSERGWYVLDSNFPKEDEKFIFRSLSVSMPRSAMAVAMLEDELVVWMNAFDLKANYSYVRSHMEQFASHPHWVAAATERLETTDVIVGNEALVKLATFERMQRILGLIEIRAEIVSSSFAKNLK